MPATIVDHISRSQTKTDSIVIRGMVSFRGDFYWSTTAGRVSISSIPCEIAYKYAGHIANPQNSAAESPLSMHPLDVAAARVKRPVAAPEFEGDAVDRCGGIVYQRAA
jgi:hypothetical protein